jgi:hypothetical protein
MDNFTINKKQPLELDGNVVGTVESVLETDSKRISKIYFDKGGMAVSHCHKKGGLETEEWIAEEGIGLAIVGGAEYLLCKDENIDLEKHGLQSYVGKKIVSSVTAPFETYHSLEDLSSKGVDLASLVITEIQIGDVKNNIVVLKSNGKELKK